MCHANTAVSGRSPCRPQHAVLQALKIIIGRYFDAGVIQTPLVTEFYHAVLSMALAARHRLAFRRNRNRLAFGIYSRRTPVSPLRVQCGETPPKPILQKFSRGRRTHVRIYSLAWARLWLFVGSIDNECKGQAHVHLRSKLEPSRLFWLLLPSLSF